MTLPRFLLRAAAASAATLALSAAHGAETAAYPSRPITLVVPYAAGGLSDSLARALAQRLAGSLKQQFIVDNKPGGNTVIGAQAVAKAAPDGYTLLLTAEATLAMNPHLYAKLPYSVDKSFAPVAVLANLPQSLAVSPTLGTPTLAAFVAKAKAPGSAINYATLGIGSTPHLNMELFQRQAGTRMSEVPYKGAAPAITDLMGGHVGAMIVATGLVAPYASSGRIKLLAVAGEKRSPLAPEVPTFAEAGFAKFAPSSWFALLAVAGTPPEVVSKLNQAVNAVLHDPAFQSGYLQKNGLEAVGGSPAQLATLIRSEDARWGALIREANIKLE